MAVEEVDLDKVTKEELEKKIRAELEITYHAAYVKKSEELETTLREENRKAMQQVVDDWRNSQKPPNPEEITLLLNQEYAEFKVKLPDPGSGSLMKEFTIVELPQTIEKKFYKRLKDHLLPRLGELSALIVRLADEPTDKKILTIIELFEPSFDLLAETVTIILNPYENNGVTTQWVQDKISSYRQWNIVLAQERANRIRDFFSHVSRGSISGIAGGASSPK
jgi:hypothetical protein